MASLPEPLRVWGLRRNPNNVRAWEKIAIGDTALFYANKAYRYAGVVRHKWQDSSGIPLAAHGPASDDLFPLQFVVTDLRECLLSIADYNDLRGYKPGYFPADPHVGSGDDAVAVLNAIGLAVLDDTEIVTALSAEGQRKYRRHLAVERRASNRRAILSEKGYKCEACNFDFRERYGDELGDYAEVHHLKPLSLGEQSKPIVADFAVLCANCHRAVHRQSAIDPISIDALRNVLRMTTSQESQIK